MHAGALVDVQDPEGYTPLHMAAGYLHSDSVNALLAGGADMTRPDRQGRDVCSLVDTLRGRMTSASAIQQRMRLEEVSGASSPVARSAAGVGLLWLGCCG